MSYRDAYSRDARAAGLRARKERATWSRELSSSPLPFGEVAQSAGEGRRAQHASGQSLQPAACSLSTLALCVLSASASAATWEFAPRIEGGYRFNDNYRLDLPGGELEVSGAEADARLTLRTVDPRTRIELTPRVHATYFPSESEEDSTDYFFHALAEDATPRRRMGVGVEFSHQDVVRSELPGTDFGGDLGDPANVDSGRIVAHNRRDLIRVVPNFRYDITERSLVQLDAHYTDAQYDRQLVNAQQDFTDFGASVGYGYRLSQRSQIVARALASQYETTFETQAYGGEVEWTTDFSPNARMYVTLGGQQTEPENTNDSWTSVIGGVGGRWTTQRNALFIDLTSTVGPVAAGTVVERHQLRLRIDHDISPRFGLNFGLRASRDEDIDDESGTYPTRDYATADIGIEWRWQRYLSLFAHYAYVWQEYEDDPSDASANRILIGVVYEPKRRD